MTKVGVIGLGFGQHVHLPLLLEDPRCEVVGICASSAEKAGRVAASFGISRSFDDYVVLMDQARPSAVTIAVPPVLQPEVICAAADRGIHVFCEKPLAADDAGARRAFDAIERSGIVSGLDFIFPELQTWKELKKFLQGNAFGSLRHIALTWRLETYAYLKGVDSWKRQPSSGGGALSSFGSHTFYYLEWLFGPIAAIRATLEPTDGSEARSQISIRFRSGLTGTVSIATDAFGGVGHQLEVYGTAASAILANLGADYARDFSLKIRTREDSEMRTVVTEDCPDEDGRLMATRALLKRFISAVQSGDGMEPDASHALRVQRLIELSRESDAEAKWVTL